MWLFFAKQQHSARNNSMQLQEISLKHYVKERFDNLKMVQSNLFLLKYKNYMFYTQLNNNRTGVETGPCLHQLGYLLQSSSSFSRCEILPSCGQAG